MNFNINLGNVRVSRVTEGRMTGKQEGKAEIIPHAKISTI